MKKIGILFVFALSMCKGPAETIAPTDLKPAEFNEKFQNTPDAMLIDVRTLGEVKDGCIKGQINLDYKSEGFKMLLAGLDRNKTYFLYCEGGVRSAKTAEMMEDLDFKKVYTLAGGFKAWKEAGMPVKDPMKRQ